MALFDDYLISAAVCEGEREKMDTADLCSHSKGRIKLAIAYKSKRTVSKHTTASFNSFNSLQSAHYLLMPHYSQPID